MDKERKWTSYYEDEMAISIKLPIDWNVGTSKNFQLILLAQEVDGYSVNVAINSHEFSGDEAAFNQAISNSNNAMAKEYKGYTKLKEEQCWIDGYPAYHQVYSWIADEDNQEKNYIQTLTLIYDMKSRLFELNGTTLKNLPESNVQLMEEIISSLRIIH